jgi:two-component system chemotaxis sensor kinase CheA
MTVSNINDYLVAYLEEFDEVMQTLDHELLELEKDGGSKETIQRFFRAAHTLKGSSAAMGFEPIKNLTHHMENVFDDIRQDKLTVSRELINVIFSCIDVLRSMKDAVVSDTLTEIDIQHMIVALEAIKAGQPLFAETDEEQSSSLLAERDILRLLEPHQQEEVLISLDQASNVFYVNVELEKDSIMKAVRHLMVYNALIESGFVMTPSPEFDDDEDVDSYSYVIITTISAEDLEQMIVDISAVAAATIIEVTHENIHSFVKLTNEAAGDNTVTEASDETRATAEHSATAQQTTNGEATKVDVTKLKVNQTVRVDVDRLESLLNLVGELVIDNTRLAELKKTIHQQVKDRNSVQLFDEITNHISRVISDLQAGMMKTRMFPIDQLFNRFPRMIRDLAHQSGKELDFVIEGKETELDRNLIEEISDPLIHLLRNAVDHGVESPDEREALGKPRRARLVLKAEHAENQVVITIADDGRGIDAEKIRESSVRKGFISAEEARKLTDKEAIQYIFASGVSTAETVTEISGRGVGMDIVRSHIEKLNGLIDIDTTVGQGTIFKIKVPLTLAIIRSLLVMIGQHMFAIPLVNVMEIVRIEQSDIRLIKGQEVCSIRGTVYPVVKMHDRLMQTFDDSDPQKALTLVVLGLADKRVGLLVDDTVGNQEIVIKSLGQYVGHVPYIAGSTILGDGNVSLILDVAAIIRDEGSSLARLEQTEQTKTTSIDELLEVVTFRLADVEYGLEIQSIRDITRVPQITPLATAPSHVLGMIQTRGQLLPLYDLKRKLFIEQSEQTRDSRVMVIELGNRDIGLIVDKVSEVAKISKRNIDPRPDYVPLSEGKFINGIYKDENRVIILLDLQWLIEQEALDASFYQNV